MTELSVNERDLLQRIKDNEDLRPLFFRKVKGVKWFDALYEDGYFNLENNPKPIPAKEEGYVNIPYWPVVDYLVKTAPELSDEKNIVYAKKFLQIIIDITKYAKENNFSNYRTWWQFAEIITLIPYKVITLEHIDIIDFWLDDTYERGIVAQVIGEKWMPKLLKENDDHAFKLSLKIIEILYKVIFIDQNGVKKPKKSHH